MEGNGRKPSLKTTHGPVKTHVPIHPAPRVPATAEKSPPSAATSNGQSRFLPSAAAPHHANHSPQSKPPFSDFWDGLDNGIWPSWMGSDSKKIGLWWPKKYDPAIQKEALKKRITCVSMNKRRHMYYHVHGLYTHTHKYIYNYIHILISTSSTKSTSLDFQGFLLSCHLPKTGNPNRSKILGATLLDWVPIKKFRLNEA